MSDYLNQLPKFISGQIGGVSTFGGPADNGVSKSEGLALISDQDLADPWFSSLFLPQQPIGTTGLARRLDPGKFYCACRWDYLVTPQSVLRQSIVRVSANGKTVFVRPVDWGPGVDSRIIDLSPAAASVLGLATDDEAQVDLILPM